MKTRKFESAKSDRLKMLLVLFSLLLAVFVYLGPIEVSGISETGDFIGRTTFLVILYIIFIWSWRSTWYKVENEILIVKSSFLRYNIPIKEIHKIYLNQKTMHGLVKPTLSLKCILIEYGNYQTISISPVPEDEFIALLLKTNNRIKIMGS